MDGLIAFVNSKEDAVEINYIYKVLLIGLRARKLGRDAYKRMKKGDFTNTPNVKKKKTKKIIKGYGINAE